MLRSVAVMLAAPLVALPAGGAEDDAQPTPPATQSTQRVVAVTAEPAQAQPVPTEPVMGRAARRPSPSDSSHPPSPKPDVPVSVSVDCANDGCVVQDGLDVRVVVP